MCSLVHDEPASSYDLIAYLLYKYGNFNLTVGRAAGICTVISIGPISVIFDGGESVKYVIQVPVLLLVHYLPYKWFFSKSSS